MKIKGYLQRARPALNQWAEGLPSGKIWTTDVGRSLHAGLTYHPLCTAVFVAVTGITAAAAADIYFSSHKITDIVYFAPQLILPWALLAFDGSLHYRALESNIEDGELPALVRHSSRTFHSLLRRCAAARGKLDDYNQALEAYEYYRNLR